ncbi:hypothetical protein [Amycolatopsis sp. PS_44_ISF1]|uniref:hypothetical protein n=1 Tax=Amycolatopsis sp. PS_44_ISF1 TaxID=2974917 RepID=UPI0028E06FEF|nr:hypothetical protein [Amycolatopsis sp. PS_44_ISF1]MDT8912341.1 hypothetical protein [Amycolatopsis sp. PS_44_ISF1]
MTLRRILGGTAAIATGLGLLGPLPAASAEAITEPVAVHCDLAHYYANYDQANDKFYGEQADTAARGATMNRRIKSPFEGPRGVVVFHVDQWYFTTRACLG